MTYSDTHAHAKLVFADGATIEADRDCGDLASSLVRALVMKHGGCFGVLHLEFEHEGCRSRAHIPPRVGDAFEVNAGMTAYAIDRILADHGRVTVVSPTGGRHQITRIETWGDAETDAPSVADTPTTGWSSNTTPAADEATGVRDMF